MVRSVMFAIFVGLGLCLPCAAADVRPAGRLQLPSRVLIGLGAGSPISEIKAQGLHPDILDNYLVGVGPTSWPYWNAPEGSYVLDVATADAAIGATPMFTLYQMATNGDGNISDITDGAFMQAYWSQAKLMYEEIKAFGKPVFVNLEPDFWGYVEQKAPGGDPTKLKADVEGEPACKSLPNTAAGIAQCLIVLARTYAPNARIGFPPSLWSNDDERTAQYMLELGAGHADFIVAQTSSRDAGCEELPSPPPGCSGHGPGPFYWDESNKRSPNFAESIAAWHLVSTIEHNLPIVYWQTPLGVPSSTPGGTNQHYRDDHVDYMLKHTEEFAQIGVVGIVFSTGASSQTNLSTDGGEFKRLFEAYLAHPAWLHGAAAR